MTGGWKVEENQKQVSLHFPPALEIAIAIPTFPPPRTRFYSWKGEPKTAGPTTLSSGSFFDENMLCQNCPTQDEPEKWGRCMLRVNNHQDAGVGAHDIG